MADICLKKDWRVFISFVKKIILLAAGAVFLSYCAYGNDTVGEEGTVGMQPKFNFAIGYSTVYRRDYNTLRAIADLFSKYPHSQVFVAGHADSIGTESVNEELTDARAASVKTLLIEYGVSASAIRTLGFRYGMPISENKTKEGRKSNRRVEVIFYKITKGEAKELLKEVGNSPHMSVIKDTKRLQAMLKQGLSSRSVVKTRKTITRRTLKRSEVESSNLDAEQSSEQNIDLIEESPSMALQSEEIESSEDEIKENVYESEDQKAQSIGLAFMLGPNWSSVYYDGTTGAEFGELEYLSLGLNIEARLSTKFTVDGYAYYLPSAIRTGTSGLLFDETKFENNLYGLRLGYLLKENKKNHFRVNLGFSSHILGGLEHKGGLGFDFLKFNHVAASIGVLYRRYLGQKWSLTGDLAYQLPLSLSSVDDFSGRLWYRGALALERSLTERWNMRLEYQAVYHESEMTFDTGAPAVPEFFVQSLLLGVKYQF